MGLELRVFGVIGLALLILVPSAMMGLGTSPSRAGAGSSIGPPVNAASAHTGAVLPSSTTVGGAWSSFRYNASGQGRSPLVGPVNGVLEWTGHLDSSYTSPVQSPTGSVEAFSGVCVYSYSASGARTCLWNDRSIRAPGYAFSTPAEVRGSKIVVANLVGSILEAGTVRHSTVPLWSVNTGSAVLSSPVISSNGTVYVGSDNDDLYAISPHGAVDWTYRTSGEVQSSPAIGLSGTIYVGSLDGSLYAILPNGTLAWSYATGGPVFSSPAVSASGMIYFGSNDHYLYALYPNGSLAWRFLTGGVVSSSPAVGWNGTLYVGSDDSNLYAVYPNGTEQWAFPTSGPVFSSPAVDRAGDIFVASTGGDVYGLSDAGTTLWSYHASQSVYGSPIIGFGEQLYLNVGKTIYAFKDLPTPHFINVTVVERGLPVGTNWTASVGGVAVQSNTTSITVVVRSLTAWGWGATTSVRCGFECQYSSPGGSIPAGRIPVRVEGTFYHTFEVRISTNDVGGSGSTSPKAGSILWLQKGTNISVTATPGTPLSAFVNWSTVSPALRIANVTDPSTTVHVNGPGTIVASFGSVIGAPSHFPRHSTGAAAPRAVDPVPLAVQREKLARP